MAYQDLFARCRLALKMNDIKLAEQLALQILEADQEDASAYILIGNVYTAKGEINRAIQSYQRSIELYPNNPEGYNNIGLIYRKEGNLPAALNALHKAFSLAPDRADISYNLGNICRAQGKNKEAVGYFKKAVEIDPEFILGYNSLALASQREGKTADAINYFNQALVIDTNHPTIRLNLGSLEEQNSNYTKALEHYKIAVRSKPSWPIGLKNLAGLQYRLKMFSAAEITYKKLVSLSPRDMEARLNLISCISETGNKSQALLLLQQILTEHHENTHALELIAKIHVEMENLDEAEGVYRSILAISPDSLDIRINLAELFIRTNKYAEAAEQLQYVLSKDKSRPRAYFIMGRMARQQGQTAQAIDSFELLMSLDPNFTEGRFQLANLYRDQKQYDKALKQLNILLSADKTNADARKLAAILYYEQKMYSEALTHFTALYYEYPKDEFIIDSIKKCYEALGETDKAVRFAESLLQAKDGTADVLENLDRLQHTLSMYESIVDTMPEDFNQRMSRNIQRLSEEDDIDSDGDEPQEENLYLQDIHEIAGEYVPIIDVGGIEPVIAVNEEDRETIFLDEMEEALEEYPELDEEPDEAQKFEGSLKGGDGQGPAAPAQPVIMPAPAAAPQSAPTLLDKSLSRSTGNENTGTPEGKGGSDMQDLFPPSEKEPSFMPAQKTQASQPAPSRPSPAPSSPSSQQVQGGSVSISVPSVITIKTETDSGDKKKKRKDRKKARKDKKRGKKQEEENTEKTSSIKIPLPTGQPQALSTAQASAAGSRYTPGKTRKNIQPGGGTQKESVPKPAGGGSQKESVPKSAKPAGKPEETGKKQEKGKKKKDKKKKKPSFFQRLRKKAEEGKKEGSGSGENRKSPAKEKTDAQKREDLFTYLANLTQFLPADAKKDFQKSGVMNKIEKLSNKFERKGDFKKQIDTLFPEKEKPASSQYEIHTDRVTGDKIVDTLAFMTKLTEHLPQKPETLAIQQKIEHILSTIKRGKDGSK